MESKTELYQKPQKRNKSKRRLDRSYQLGQYHTGQCKSTGGCYNELVVAYFSTGGGVKWRKR